MKKIIGIAAVAAMVATSAFAGVNVGGWGRSGVNLVEKSSEKVTTKSDASGSTTVDATSNPDATVSVTPGWATGSRVGVNFSGTSDDGNIGFNLNVDSNGGNIGIGDQAKVWGKIGFLTVQFGKIQLDELRGSVGDWGNRDIGSKGEDDIFTRFYPGKGMTVELRPVDGLFIGGMINVAAAGNNVTSDTAENVYKSAAGGIGYTIKDVAQIKAAYFGSATTDHYGRLEFGVDLLGIKDNLIEIGVKLPMSKDSVDGYFSFCAGLKGGKDKLSYKGHLYGNFAPVTSYKINTLDANSKIAAATITLDNAAGYSTIGLDAGVEYDLGSFILGGTAKYSIGFGSGKVLKNDYSSVANNFGAELYAKKGFSNGYLFAGVADDATITVGTSKVTVAGTTVTGTNTDVANNFYIPVGAEYWF